VEDALPRAVVLFEQDGDLIAARLEQAGGKTIACA
jgi:hypothetical protein